VAEQHRRLLDAAAYATNPTFEHFTAAIEVATGAEFGDIPSQDELDCTYVWARRLYVTTEDAAAQLVTELIQQHEQCCSR